VARVCLGLFEDIVSRAELRTNGTGKRSEMPDRWGWKNYLWLCISSYHSGIRLWKCPDVWVSGGIRNKFLLIFRPEVASVVFQMFVVKRGIEETREQIIYAYLISGS
jgi:hypothetical protein